MEIEIIRDDLAADLLAEAHELGIHLSDIVKIDIRDLNLDFRPLTDALQNVEATAPARALEYIGGIRNMLKLTIIVGFLIGS